MSSPTLSSDDEDETNGLEVLSEGIASTVYLGKQEDGHYFVVKNASTIKKFAPEPHDIVKELRILEILRQHRHSNLISFDDSWKEPSSLSIRMPYIPLSVSQILDSPRFIPGDDPQLFTVLSRSLAFQMASALAHLHCLNIAHRDVKPTNFLLTDMGCVKLVDFGISYIASHQGDLWPEREDNKYFEVSTGPYRAPELMFGTRTYDPFSVDSWSLGCTIAQFFTRLGPEPGSDDEDFGLPPGRQPLFDASRGEIGLTRSIFKTLGTPNNESWPSFNELPHANRVDFTMVPGIDLKTVLPNLPVEKPGADALSFIKSLLVYPPEDRLKAVLACGHPWMLCGPLTLPPEVESPAEAVEFPKEVRSTTLGSLLADVLA